MRPDVTIASVYYSSGVPISGYICVGVVAVVVVVAIVRAMRSMRRERRLQREERAALRHRSGPERPNVIEERGAKRRRGR